MSRYRLRKDPLNLETYRMYMLVLRIVERAEEISFHQNAGLGEHISRGFFEGGGNIYDKWVANVWPNYRKGMHKL